MLFYSEYIRRQAPFSQLSLVFAICWGLWGCEVRHESFDAHAELLENAKKTALRHMSAGKMEEAKAYYDSVYNTIDIPSKSNKIQRHLFYGGNYYGQLNDAEKSISSLDSIGQLIDKNTKDLQLLSTYILSLFLTGDKYFEIGSYNKAFKKYDEAKNLMPQIEDPCKRGHHQYRLGMTHYKQGLYEDAKNYFEDSFKLTSSCSETFQEYALRQELLNNISLTFDKLNNRDSSAHYLTLSMHLLAEGSKKYPQRLDYFNRVKAVYLQQSAQNEEKSGKINLALYHTNRAYQYLQPNDSLYENTQNIMYDLIRLNRIIGNSDKATEWYHKLQASLKKLPNPQVQREALLEYSKLYELSGQYSAAYNTLSKYIVQHSALKQLGRNAYQVDLQDERRAFEEQRLYQYLFENSRYQTLGLGIVLTFCAFAIIIILLFIWNIKNTTKGVLRLEYLHRDLAFQNWLLAGSLYDLKNVNNQMDQLLVMVATRLRNPAAIIKDHIAQLQQIQLPNQECKELLHMAAVAINQSSSMIEGLLEQQMDDMEPFQTVDLSKIIRESVEQSQFIAQEKSQTIHFDDQLKVNAHVQPLQFSRVVNNVIANAIKFSPKGNNIDIMLRHIAGTRVEIEVRDYGMGIPEEMIAKIFDKLSSSRRFGTDGEKSYGIGLAFCKKVILHHQGKIWIKSIPGRQTQVFISLPADNQ